MKVHLAFDVRMINSKQAQETMLWFHNPLQNLLYTGKYKNPRNLCKHTNSQERTLFTPF